MKRILLALSALLLLPGTTASALDSDEAESASATFARVPVPFEVHRAEARAFSRVGIFAEGRHFTIRNQGTVADVEGGASIYLLRNLLLTGSYRLVSYEFDLIDTRLKAWLSGPFVGMTLRF